MLLKLETLLSRREQSLPPASCFDKAVVSACTDAEVASPEMTSADTSRDYFLQIRQLRQQL